jgi:outer membrane protein OmpA-like peptidoglycan-associated protein
MILTGLLAAPALAAEPTAQDYVKEIQANAAASPPVSAGACENGEERDSSGACPVVDESPATRGFTLFSGSMAKPQGPPAKVATATPLAAREGRPLAPPAAVPCGLLCDLKLSFKSGSAVLTPDSEIKLARLADALRDPSLTSKRFEIAGHTDASGSLEKNKALSLERAQAVRTFLVAHGVQGSRLEARGYGAEGLAFPNLPLDPRNRRVEARLLN